MSKINITPIEKNEQVNLNNPSPVATRLYDEIAAATKEVRRYSETPGYAECRDCGAVTAGRYCPDCGVARVIAQIEDPHTQSCAQWMFRLSLEMVEGIAHPAEECMGIWLLQNDPNG